MRWAGGLLRPIAACPRVSSVTDTLTRLQAQDRFLVRQRFTAMVNRYDITTWTDDGSAGQLLATSQQARLKMREEVTIADPQLDRRLAAAMAVALDALQDR